MQSWCAAWDRPRAFTPLPLVPGHSTARNLAHLLGDWLELSLELLELDGANGLHHLMRADVGDTGSR